MYRTFRHYRKSETKKSVTIKEWDALEKAVAYARRYAIGAKFMDCVITDADENNKPVYVITRKGEHFVKDTTKETAKETVEVEQIVTENHINETPAYRIELVRESNPAPTCGRSVSCSEDAADIFKYIFKNTDREMFVMLALDTKKQIIGCNVVSQGTLDVSIVHPREVFKTAILLNAASILVCHNHPSGNTTPSREDLKTTKRLIKVGVLLGIPLLDHLIVGWEMGGGFRYYSFKEKNDNIF